MNIKISSIISKLINLAAVLSLSASPSSAESVKASKAGTATNTRLSGQSAFFFLDEGDRYIGLTITRDEIAHTTSLSFAYRFVDPNDSNLTIYITGEEGEIPNSAFTMSSTSAQLTLTTPDSYPVTRCVVHNETGEYTCAPTSPSTFNLTWIKDDSWMFQENSTRVETSGSVMMRTHGRFHEFAANVSGTWDGFAGTNMTGNLTDSENATLFREKEMEANLRFFTLLGLQAPMDATRMLTDKVHIREAFAFLYDGGGGVNGVVRAWQDEITHTTMLRFSYAFPDPTNPSRMLFFSGLGEIPNSAFTITSASARLRVTTPNLFPMTYCVIADVIGNPGGYTCYPSPSPITFDLTWTTDGYSSEHETSANVLTEGSATTRFHREYNAHNAPASGTWNDLHEHAGTKMIGFLTNLQNRTTTKTQP